MLIQRIGFYEGGYCRSCSHRANLASFRLFSCIQFGIYAMFVCHFIHIRRHVWNIPPQMRSNHSRLRSSYQRLRGFAGLASTKLTHEKSLAVQTQLFATELLHQIDIESTDFLTEFLWLHRYLFNLMGPAVSASRPWRLSLLHLRIL